MVKHISFATHNINLMTEKEIQEYGGEIHPLWGAENPASYHPTSSVTLYRYLENPPRLIAVEADKKITTRPIIVVAPTRDQNYKVNPIMSKIILLLQRWIPRVF